MFAHSTKSLLFKNKEGERFHLKNLSITAIPDWITETDTYKNAIEDGCLVVIDNKEKKIAAENGDLDKPTISEEEEVEEKVDSVKPAKNKKSEE